LDKKDLDQEEKDTLDAEPDILEELQHPHIITLRETIDTDRFLYLVRVNLSPFCV
jgi:hypothetical protein